MKRPFYLALLLMAGLAALPARAEWSDIDLRPTGQGYQFGKNGAFRVAPSLSIGAFWESNSRDTTSGEKSGGGWRVQPALSISYNGKENGRQLGTWSLSAFYSMERGFDSDNAQDSDSYGLSLATHRNLGRNLTLTVSASYSRSEDDQFYGDTWNSSYLSRVDKDKSESYNLNAALGNRGDRWQWSLGLGWSRTKQLTGWKDESDSYTFTALIGRAVRQHHYWNFSFSTSWDDAEESSQAYYFMTGMSGQVSDRVSYGAMVGLGVYDYSGYTNDTAVGPTYNMSVAYRYSKKLTFSAALSSQYKPEYDGDQRSYYVWSNTLTGAANMQWTNRFSSRVNLSGSYEEHVGNGGSSDYERTYLQASFNSSYKLNKFMSVYGGISWKTDDYSGSGRSSSGSRDDIRLDIGLTFTL